MVRLAFLFWLLAVATAGATPTTLFSAASLSGTLDQVLDGADCGPVRTVYAGSSTLARQILSGAPADLFISAHTDWVDALAKQGALVAGSQQIIAGNTLVLVSAAEGPPVAEQNLAEAVGSARIATGLAEAVPAGMYAKAGLQALGLWNAVRPLLVETDSVRAALALVVRGAAPWGIVYASDAQFAGTPVRFTFPDTAHPPITYTAAIIRETPTARCVIAHLTSTAAREVLVRQGFRAPP